MIFSQEVMWFNLYNVQKLALQKKTSNTQFGRHFVRTNLNHQPPSGTALVEEIGSAEIGPDILR